MTDPAPGKTTPPEQPAAGFRVRGASFELRKTGVARFDLRDPYHLALTLSWPAFLAAGLVVVLLINIGFAALFLVQPGAIQNLHHGDLLNAVFFSLETLTTVGYGEMAPATTYGHLIASAEMLVGMAFTAILTGLLFVRFSRPRSSIIFADTGVISLHDGTPTLMFRVANSRLTMLTHASASIGLVLERRSDEGHVLRRITNLALSNPDVPVFPLTWTVMHKLDDSSPLYRMDVAEMAQRDVRMFLSIKARDPALGVEIQDLRDYGPANIATGMRYVDAVVRDPRGRVTADLRRLNLIEPDGRGPGV